MHAFDLSHPNLLAFISRKGLIESVFEKNCKTRLGLFYGAIFHDAFIAKIKDYLKGNPYIKNTLSFFEIPIEFQFLLLEYYLKNPNDAKDIIVGQNNEFTINNETYNKIILCPLTVDFGYDRLDDKDTFYNRTPAKPIAKQIGDLFYSIHTYYHFSLTQHIVFKDKLQLDKITNRPLDDIKREKLFEIYPFMGLNTRNYSLEILSGKNGKSGLLDKYFSNFSKDESAEARRERLYKKIGRFEGYMYDDDEEMYKDIFAGIKVYPQLGFDPYLDADDAYNNKLKVEFLYDYCCKKRIPIISHCSDGGFEVGDFDQLTNPKNKWSKVLNSNEFQELTLDFAHFGSRRNGEKDWQEKIVELAISKSNVYTDVSCNDSTDEYYKGLNETIAKAGDKFKSKILFGSDFSILMFSSHIISYNQFLKTFIKSPDLKFKKEMCMENPSRFLFGV